MCMYEFVVLRNKDRDREREREREFFIAVVRSGPPDLQAVPAGWVETALYL